MTKKKGKRWRRKFALRLLALALLLAFCTGCSKGSKGGPGTPVGSEWTPDWLSDKVQMGTEIDSLNVILVMDASASTLQNDRDHNGVEAACMFLKTLYASAGKQDSGTDKQDASAGKQGRLPGSKSVHVDVILYNDTVDTFSDTLVELKSKKTVDTLNDFIRKVETPGVISSRSGDGALAEALERAVELLHNQPGNQEELSKRSVILLFTDGYDGYTSSGSVSPLSMGQSYTSIDGISSASSTGEASGTPVGSAGEAAAGFPFTGTADMPNFGDRHQEQMETALKRAKDFNYEIIVLMLNPDDSDRGWEQFKKIANYTERNFIAKLVPMFISLGRDPRFEGMPRNVEDFTFPENYTMLSPAFLSDPMFGGGIFIDPDSDDKNDKVNYLLAKSPYQLTLFYATLAANMLSGSSAAERNPSIETIVGKEHYCYDVEVPNSGVSALMCFFFSPDGIDGNDLIGPDPDHPGERKNYGKDLINQDNEGWANDGTMRNDWYFYKTSAGEDQCNIVGLTIIDPKPGTWSFYVRGKDGNNSSLRAYVTLVNGAKVNVYFCQGTNPAGQDHPMTGGDFAVQAVDHDGVPLPEEFYTSLRTQCSATRIPPWFPVSGEDDINDLMTNPGAWAEQVLSSYKRPEKWLTQISGGNIHFDPGEIRLDSDEKDGSPALTGHFDAPLPGLYYATLNMTAGTGNNQINYSKSFWFRYQLKSDQIIGKVNQDVSLNLRFPDAWGKTSNTSEAEELVWNMNEKSLKITPLDGTPSDFATAQVDARNPQSLSIRFRQKGHGKLSFDVTTEYGEKWTPEYDIVVN